MATLPTLIKLAERKLEYTQNLIMKTEMELAAVKALQRELAAQVQRSFQIAEEGETAENFKDAHTFQQRAVEEDIQLQARKVELEEQKESYMAQMRETFSEKKRFEILLERQLVAQKKERQAKEQAQLDDIAGRT